MPYKVIYIMGVAGAGKTTIGQQLSARTGFAFYDADNFHPQKNIDKMQAGQALTDEDRWPWLDNIHSFATEKIKLNNIIVACSALKQVYRDRLCKGIEQHCNWVFLKGDYKIIINRMKNRAGHFMPATLLQSQFEALEIPKGVIEADITMPPNKIVDYIISKI